MIERKNIEISDTVSDINAIEIIVPKHVQYILPMGEDTKTTVHTISKTYYLDRYYSLYLNLKSANVEDPYRDSLLIGTIKLDVDNMQYLIKINTDTDICNFAIHAVDTIIEYKDQKRADKSDIFDIGIKSFIDVSSYHRDDVRFRVCFSQVTAIKSIMIIDLPAVSNMYEDLYSACFIGNTIRKYAYANNPAYITKGEPI